MAGGVAFEQQYSLPAGFAFLFNVIMGNGPLTLPAAFLRAGWLMSSIILLVLCFTSFITFTFVIEAMSITNAVAKQNEDSGDRVSEVDEYQAEATDDDQIGIVGFQNTNLAVGSLQENSFEINRKFELGQMFNIFFGRLGNILFYLNICIYLYGDLAIYAAGVPKSLRNVVCQSNSSEFILSNEEPCWNWSSITRGDLYRIFVACFAVLICPFLFFHVTRSRWLQLSTTAIRWVSFILMLCLAIDRAIVVRQGDTMESLNIARAWNPALHPLLFSSNGPSEPIPNPPIIRAEGIPNLFGVCVYVFMCHHSIPGTVTPIRDKRRLMLRLFFPLFFSAFAFNMLLSGTAVAAFNDIKDLYTLNFVPDKQTSETFRVPFVLAQIFGYFLSLFPVFALSSTFPILGCTLLGNLMTLCNMFTVCHSPRARRALRYTLPFVVLLPPIIIALLTDDIGFLVGFTGAIAGSGIQYVIPAVLVYRARSYITGTMDRIPTQQASHNAPEDKEELCPSDDSQMRTPSSRSKVSACLSTLWKTPWKKVESPHASPFQHVLWIVGLIIWSMLCLVVVLVDKIHPL